MPHPFVQLDIASKQSFTRELNPASFTMASGFSATTVSMGYTANIGAGMPSKVG